MINTKIIFYILIFSYLQTNEVVTADPRKNKEIELTKERIVDTKSSDLRLISEPSLNSNTLEMIPRRSRVIFVKEEQIKTEIDGKIGRWTYVQYKDHGGWVFGAFLIKIYRFSIEESEDQNYCNIEDKLSEKFGKDGKKRSFKPNENDSETSKYEQNYKSGINLFSTIYLGGGYTTITFPNKSMEYVYDLFSKCDSDLAKIKFEPENSIFKVEFESEESISKSFHFEFRNNIATVHFGGQV